MPTADGLVLIDTSAWIHALRPGGNPEVREQVRGLLTEGRVATCEMIILELVGGTRTEGEYQELYAAWRHSSSSLLRHRSGDRRIGLPTPCNAEACPFQPPIISSPRLRSATHAACFTGTSILT